MTDQIGNWAKRLSSGVDRTIQAHPRFSRMLLAGAVAATSIGLVRNLTSDAYSAWLWLILLGIATSLLLWCARRLDRRRLGLDLLVGLVGVLVTYLLLELVVIGVFWKAKLISDMGSAENRVAVAAVEKLRQRGWLGDGTLRGADLRWADLRGANLREANLRETDLRRAILCEADLSRAKLGGHKNWAIFEGLGNPLGGPGPWIGPADLREANLREANLRGADLSFGNLIGAYLREANLYDADLSEANLREAYLREANLFGTTLDGADLSGADLRGANLFRTNLRGADLSGADLRGANLGDADLSRANLAGSKFDAKSILPDHTKWTLGTDVTRFADPDPPD